MNTVQVTIPDPTVLPTVTVDWTTGATTATTPTAVVNIPIGVGVPGPPGESVLPAVIDLGGAAATTGA